MSTKVTSSLITSVDGSTLINNTVPLSAINTSAGDAGKLLSSNGSTLSWVASSSIGGSGGTGGVKIGMIFRTCN